MSSKRRTLSALHQGLDADINSSSIPRLNPAAELILPQHPPALWRRVASAARFFCQSPLWGLRACEAISLFLSLRAQRGNLSFLVRPAPNNRDRHVPRDDRRYCHCEPAKQSLFSLLANPGHPRSLRAFVLSKPLWGLRAQRGNLSFLCWPALDNRDRHVPRDDRKR